MLSVAILQCNDFTYTYWSVVAQKNWKSSCKCYRDLNNCIGRPFSFHIDFFICWIYMLCIFIDTNLSRVCVCRTRCNNELVMRSNHTIVLTTIGVRAPLPHNQNTFAQLMKCVNFGVPHKMLFNRHFQHIDMLTLNADGGIENRNRPLDMRVACAWVKIYIKPAIWSAGH